MGICAKGWKGQPKRADRAGKGRSQCDEKGDALYLAQQKKVALEQLSDVETKTHVYMKTKHKDW